MLLCFALCLRSIKERLGNWGHSDSGLDWTGYLGMQSDMRRWSDLTAYRDAEDDDDQYDADDTV